jgi:hypothetical protein
MDSAPRHWEGLKAATNQEASIGVGQPLASEKRQLDRDIGGSESENVLRCDSGCSWFPVIVPVPASTLLVPLD